MPQRMKFTDDEVRNLAAAPEGKRLTIYDEDIRSLALRITSNGVKTWTAARRIGRCGPWRRTTLGRFPDLGTDRVGLVGGLGSPTNEPAGIYVTNGVGKISSVGTPADYSKILEGVQALLEANVPIDVATANAIMSPRSWAKFEGLPTGISSDKTQLARPRALENMAFRVTSAVPNNLGAHSPADESVIFLGDFSQLILGVRLEASVEALKLTNYATNLLIEYVGYGRFDFMIARPASLEMLAGVTA